jgi:hypothetical protein
MVSCCLSRVPIGATGACPKTHALEDLVHQRRTLVASLHETLLRLDDKF